MRTARNEPSVIRTHPSHSQLIWGKMTACMTTKSRRTLSCSHTVISTVSFSGSNASMRNRSPQPSASYKSGTTVLPRTMYKGSCISTVRPRRNPKHAARARSSSSKPRAGRSSSWMARRLSTVSSTPPTNMESPTTNSCDCPPSHPSSSVSGGVTRPHLMWVYRSRNRKCLVSGSGALPICSLSWMRGESVNTSSPGVPFTHRVARDVWDG